MQSLAAGAMCLEAARRELYDHPDGAARAIGEVQELLESEQQELRDVIATWCPDAGANRPGRPLEERLARLKTRLQRYWRLEVELEQRVAGTEIGDAVGREVYWILREGLINAARHGRAAKARVELEAADGGLRLAIRDNGSGFAFRGRYDPASLANTSLGPYHLGQRVQGLGGRLEIESSDSGATLEIWIPAAA
jgi:signal transduction histidine kinase